MPLLVPQKAQAEAKNRSNIGEIFWKEPVVRVGIPSQSPSLRTRPKHTPDRDKLAERQENELSMKFSETDDLETKTQQFFQFFSRL